MHKRKETLSYKVEFKFVHVYVAGMGPTSNSSQKYL